MQVAQACLYNVSLHQFWSIANNFPELVSLPHAIRLMGNCSFNGGIPWLSNTDGAHCFFFCKESIKDVSHFLFDCSEFRDDFESVWVNLGREIMSSNSVAGVQIANLLVVQIDSKRLFCYWGGLRLPFDQATATLNTRFLSTAVSKVYHIRLERLRELKVPWLSV